MGKQLFLRLGKQYPEFKDKNGNADATAFTEIVNGEVQMKDKRPALVISSTSWTEDEDFSILLDALESMASLHAYYYHN